ncbi:16509_t:CDS:1, partial [Funneliformis mosseae]
ISSKESKIKNVEKNFQKKKVKYDKFKEPINDLTIKKESEDNSDEDDEFFNVNSNIVNYIDVDDYNELELDRIRQFIYVFHASKLQEDYIEKNI